jgi:hypothetical protein
MGKKLLVLFVVIGMVLSSAAGFIFAATTVQDVIRMENKAYEEHTKAIVDFTHKKHNEEYKIGCGECNHDDKGKPLNNFKLGDEVQSCIECHQIPGQMPGELKKELRAKKVSMKEL